MNDTQSLPKVLAGFPVTADDLIEYPLDLNTYVVKNPSATFFMRVDGDSMRDVGIYSDDIVVIDRSLTPKNGDIIVASFDGNLLIKRFSKEHNQFYLTSENSKYHPIKVNSVNNFEVWGVVTHSLKTII